MTTYVLVPGAWLGGEAWRAVAEQLRDRGHDVYPVTLTGLGDRADEGSPQTDLDTHIGDIVSILDGDDLREVVLVGHSYGGVPVTGAADRRPDRVAHLVFVDSGPAPDGVAQADFSPPEAREATDRMVAEHGDGWRMAPIAFDPDEDPINLAGLDERALAELRRQASPHPYGSTTQPISLTGAVDRIPRTLVACTMPAEAVQQMIDDGNPFFAGLKDARVISLPTGHWPMFSAPHALTDALVSVAPTS
jgi:pimeloyl-ACP methyl ester carboxylesterase